ncbi:MAG: NADH-quinone oxidoreductase subunit NuoF [Blastochloris viridis]|uniref:NADH-quinone oxidoreductase subunit F n=1 Tax=Blastochloris viridis TaxID=1079 RepID=A0A6N4R398_BLAVI|nr:MAG: NADH-quinone oxidoreductase subunit NuoF [Blastochloris viridis]
MTTLPRLKSEDKCFPNLDGSGDWGIKGYQKRGGYKGLKELLQTPQMQHIDKLKASSLRGRGGAGFPTGMKWSFMPQPKADESGKIIPLTKPSYLVCNADEGEPGTCKDRDILRFDPHTLVEGMIVGCYTLNAKVGYIYVRGEYYDESSHLQQAINEAYAAGFLGKNILGTGVDVDIHVHLGAGAYICGEETALLESLEGKKGQPRLKPPFPAGFGLYGCPTTINNVETIAQVPPILKHDLEWFTRWGRPGNSGTKIFSISGSVNKPGNVEAPMSIPLRELIDEYCGGVIGGWDNLQAIIPGGSSTPMLNPEQSSRVLMDFDALKAEGTGLGTAAIVVMNKDVDVLRVMTRIAGFYHHESCGQCTPCREGVGWVHRLMERLSQGDGTVDELDQLYALTKKIEGRTICAFADGAMWPTQGTLKHFRHLFEERIKAKQSAA